MGQVSVNLPTSLRSAVTVLRTLASDQNSALTRLSTGLKINSAVEGPQPFFAARGLNQRAGDLDSLKSGIAQSISSIQAANTGATAVKGLLDQARGLTTVALANLDDTPASVTTRAGLAEQFDTILRQIDKVVGDSSYAGKNLLQSQPARFAATDDSVRNTSAITGIDHAEVTSVAGANSYRVVVRGNGDINGDAGDVIQAQDTLGLAELRVGGFNSLTRGSFDDIRFELRGTPGRDAKLVILDGEESKTFDFSQAQLKQAADTGTQLSIRHVFSDGAQISFQVDGDTLRNALQPAGVVRASVRRNVDLQIDVTNNEGVTETRSAATQDQAARLRAGENSFRFADGTVRLTVDPKLIQSAAFTTGGLQGDLAPFAAAITSNGATTINQQDTQVRLEVEKLGFGSSNIALNQYVQTAGSPLTFFQSALNQAGGPTVGGTLPNGSVAAVSVDAQRLRNVTSNGIFLLNRNPGQGGLTTIADGNFDAGEFSNPYTSGFKQSAILNVNYGALVNGERDVIVSDGLGGAFSGKLQDTGDGQPSVVTLIGGPNNGATIGLFHADGSSGIRNIEVLVGRNSFATPDDPLSASFLNFDDVIDWRDFIADTAISFAVGAPDSDAPGQRSITISQTLIDDGSTASETVSIPNNGFNDFTYTLTQGPNAGARVHLDIPGFGATLNYRVAVANPPVGAANAVARSARTGETSSLDTEQVSVATADNNLVVDFNPDGSSRLNVNAVNITSGAAGLRIDGAANQWRDRRDVLLAVDDLNRADARLQAATRELDVNLDLLRARDTYTDAFTNVLREGAQKLIAADQNEEGANALTANVRSQLATISISLIQQQQQSILRLF